MRGYRWLPLWLFLMLDPLGLLAQTLPLSKDKEKKPDLSATQGEIGGRTLKEWVKDLQNVDPSLREEACRIIPFFGKEAGTLEIVNLIVARTLDQDVGSRSQAIASLARMDLPRELQPKATKAVADRLQLENETGVRAMACLALVAMGEKAQSAIPVLLKGSTDPASWEIRRHCVHALGNVGRINDTDSPDPRCVKGLLMALKDRTYNVRLEAIKGFGRLGRPADTMLQMDVEKELVRLANDKDKVISIWSWMSLMCVTDVNPTAIKAIRELIQDKEPRIRIAAMGALAQIGTYALFATGDLAKATKDPDPGVKFAAVTAIGYVEEVGKPTLESQNALQAIINDKDADEDMKRYAKNVYEHIKGIKKNEK